MSLPTSFEPGSIESKWYDYWKDRGYFAPDPGAPDDPYCILLPPPNVTGTLHMGHAFQQTIMDALIRHARMSGRRTLWQGGTDHAGIATQKIVENQLAAEGNTRHDLGREAFAERVWQWKEHSGSTIGKQMQRLGASVDWSRERFTMDEGLSTAVRKVFVEWYRAGLIYRGKRLVHWDPVLQTAVSDLEVDNEERDGFLWSILYPFSDESLRGPNGERGLIVATTRPETMLGDVAVAVHPDDERYKKFIGKTLTLPLTGREIPVIADDYVDREFGTGCVKITPAHDFNDYAIGQRHGLQMLSVLTLDAKIIDNRSWTSAAARPGATGKVRDVVDVAEDIGIPEPYWGLDRYDARKAIIADLEAQGLLVATRPHKLQVPISQRSGAVIEPMLTDQWFVDLTRDVLPDGRPGGRKAITEPALRAVTSGAIKFVPENWSSTYTQWLENIQDWCISRQLWWGHRIPAWYDNDGTIFVGENEADARAHAAAPPVGALRQDDDVLDTWFSSALWPFSTLGWPNLDGPVSNERGEIVADWSSDQAFLPSAVLVTGFDIIFFWVARMVMATAYFVGRNPDGSYTPERQALKDRVPFREVYINAIVRDAEGQKMSKSKGNTIDPLDLIDGIGLEELVRKSIASLLIPQVRARVEKRIRKDYPEGITAVGTDALRFTFAALATHGRTINFDLKRAEGYKNFCNKLWNAARFVLMNTEGFSAAGEPALRTAAEKWIHVRFWEALKSVAENFAAYRFDLVAQDLYQFVWNDYCDWFVELTKLALNGEDEAAVASTRHTLLVVLEAALRALHPIVPFITEEIWQEVAPRLGLDAGSILARPYPCVDLHPEQLSGAALDDFQAHTRGFPLESTQIDTLIIAVNEVRSLRSQLGVSPARQVPLLIEGQFDDAGLFDSIAPMLRALCRVERIEYLPAGTTPPASAAKPLFGAVVHIPLVGLIDLDAERARVAKELKRVETEIAKCQAKLDSATFVANAPAAVVEQERQRLADWGLQLKTLREHAARLG
ncbi:MULTISPECIES: valine--tRNA ligase [Metallibacterium]|jgi:valyl-tRNA synthetase|uniref:valine--tRNA ligase n=1 Tax=Metallibacterium TaxID=1218803 RepID=UPI0026169B1F|nr:MULTISPECIES: valine--tRNA ligase [Metallibacterium]MBW8076073.1 valine--tRNA ligase [Metallibacterium scheffleri]